MRAKILATVVVNLLFLGCWPSVPQAADALSGRYALRVDDDARDKEKLANIYIVIRRAEYDYERPWRFILEENGRQDKNLSLRDVAPEELGGLPKEVAGKTRCITGDAMFCVTVPGTKIQRRNKVGFEEVVLKTGYFAVVVHGTLLELEKFGGGRHGTEFTPARPDGRAGSRADLERDH